MEKQNANSRQLDFIVRRDRHLTEAMGECWHESNGRLNCKKCESFLYAKSPNHISYNNEFSTWEGFGKLWRWGQQQEWWEEFVGCLLEPVIDKGTLTHYRKFDLDFIDPDKFADALYEFVDA